MNDSNAILCARLERELQGPTFNRARRRRCTAIANTLQRRGILRPHIVAHYPRVHALAVGELRRRMAAEHGEIAVKGKGLGRWQRIAARVRTFLDVRKAASQ